mgnify:CR=1 FL=1|jgi:hypothetical protein
MIEIESYTLYKILKNANTELFSKLSASFFTGYNLALFKKIENYYTATQSLCSLDEFTNLKKDIVVDNYFQKYVLDPEYENLVLDDSFLCRQLEENYTKRHVLDGLDTLLTDYDNLETGEIVDMIGNIQLDLNNSLPRQDELFDVADIESFPDAETFIIYPSGLSNEWDSVNGGFALQELVLLGGRRGSGKSIISLNALRTRYEQGHTVALFSIEMRYKEVYDRLMSSVSGVPFLHLYKSQTSVQEKMKLAEARLKFWYEDTISAQELLYDFQTNGEYKEFDKQIKKIPKKKNRFYIVDDTKLSLSRFDHYQRKFSSEHENYSMSVVDYLNIVEIPDRINWQSQIIIADNLKVSARKYNQTVMSPYQIAEDGEARFAKGILDSADKSIIFMPQDQQEQENQSPDTISLLKMYTSKIRNGRPLTFDIGIHWPTVRVYPSGQLHNSQLLPGEKYGSDDNNNKENATDILIT